MVGEGEGYVKWLCKFLYPPRKYNKFRKYIDFQILTITIFRF